MKTRLPAVEARREWGGCVEPSAGIVLFTSSCTSITGGSSLPSRVLKYYREKEAGRGNSHEFPPFLRSGIFLGNASMIYVFITNFCVFDANTFSDNLFILRKCYRKNISHGSVMAELYGDIFHQVEQL